MAITDCLNRLEENAPQKRVGIVAFSKNVEVLGDGCMDKIVIEGSSLSNMECIKATAQMTPQFETIETNKENLVKAFEK